jgi:sugar phosphate isomerase/epimerase
LSSTIIRNYYIIGKFLSKLAQTGNNITFHKKKEELMEIRGPIGCSTNCYHGFDLDTALNGIARAGIRYVELTSVDGYTEHVMPERMTGEDTKTLLKKLQTLRLTPMSMSGHSNLASREGVELLKKRIDFAKAIGIDIVNTGPGEVETEAGQKEFFNNIAKIAQYAAESAVTVALETHGELMGSGAACAEILRKINSPWVQMNYDTGNVIFYGGVNPEEDIKAALPHLAHVHLKDKRGGKKIWDFPPLGMGDVNFQGFFDTLLKARYSGPISIEIEVLGKDTIPSWLVSDERGEIISDGKKDYGPEIVDKALARSLAYLKTL